jgi:NAD(P)-dependent dehydrogenase (short-subunit alcohol dehydrogenase family)
MDYQGKVVIVTGGASGLGGATANMIAAAGGKVLIADVNAELGTRFAAEIGSGSRFIRCDVTSDADARAAVSAACDMGALAGLVNCAGVGSPGKTVGKEGPLPLEAFSRVININLIGTFNMIRIAAAAMMGNAPSGEGERGVIVNTASVAAFDGQIGQAAYAASKGGVVGMTLPIARELARDGIRVVTIAPGLFLTPLLQSLPPAAQESLGKQVPFPARLGRPDEFAQMVGHVFANLMINGETIRLDGAIRMAPK